MLTEERTRTDQTKVKKALVTAGIILLVILLSVGASILACKKSASTVKNGLSAYEIAQAYGYEGSVQDWLTSLNGKSAYEIAKESGYTGTESEFSASLAANAKGDAVSIKSASFNQAGELILLLSDGSSLNVGKAVGAAGADGKNGTDGADGKDGANGSAGVSIINAKVNEKGQLLLAFSDGKTINLDKITGTNGQDGIGITNSEINANGELVLTYSNGQTANLGTVIGAKGEKGDTGAAGTPGEKGDKGDTGAAGQDGIFAAPQDILQGRLRFCDKAGDGVVLRRLDEVQHMVPDTMHLRRGDFGGAHVQAAVNLHGIRRNDLALKLRRQLHRQSGFSAGGRPADGNNPRFIQAFQTAFPAPSGSISVRSGGHGDKTAALCPP